MKEDTSQKELRPLSLYIHIPFCKEKCAYCDFLSFGGQSGENRRQYIEALCKEIKAYEEMAKEYCVQTIFIGGGTPSYIELSLMEQVMDKIKEVFVIDEDVEITIEGNPDSLTEDKLAGYRKMGINRLSIGLQSADDEMLKILGRVHTFDQFLIAYDNARKAGFTNINVDLMSGLPGEDKETYLHTLDTVLNLCPEHISAYSLIVEDETPLAEDEELLARLPSEEDDRELYTETGNRLLSKGYTRYEISNYAREGYECRHNIVYWTGGEYLGLGLGASSYLKIESGDGHKKLRFHDVETMKEYLDRFATLSGMEKDAYTGFYEGYEMYDEYYGYAGDICGEDMLSDVYDASSFAEDSDAGEMEGEIVFLEFIRDYYKDLYFQKRKDEMEEFMFLGLRMTGGVSKAEFQKRFSTGIETIYGKVLEKYEKNGLLTEKGDRIFLTDKGIDVSNVVMAEFLL